MPAEIGYFDTLKSTAGKVFAYLATITLTGTDGKTLTVEDDSLVNQDLTTDADPTFDTLALTSGQLVFPAAQVASAGANTFDDYEEYTWIPTLSFGGGTTGITYNASYHEGTYTKIGRMVFFSAYIVLTSKGSSVGNALVSGLPFPSENSDGHSSVVTFGPTNLINYGSFPFARITNNASTINLGKPSATGVPAYLTDADFSDASSFMLSGHYTAA